MALTIDDVRKVASLARLRLDPQDERAMARELGTIVEYIDLLQDYDAPLPPPVESPVDNLDSDDPWVLDDQPRACLPREWLLANAPAAVDGQVVVPTMFGLGERAGRGEDEGQDD